MREYLSDEELTRLIEELEEQELYAPKYLKEEILNKAFPKQTEQAQPEPKSARQKPVSMFAYRFKIIAGMAAALIMLILIPMGAGNGREMEDMARRQKRMEDMEQEYLDSSNESLNNILNESTRKFDRKINSWFNFMKTAQFDN